jgi:hypothetical protein
MFFDERPNLPIPATFARGEKPSVWEFTSSSFDQLNQVDGATSLSRMTTEEYDNRIQAIESAGGPKLENPYLRGRVITARERQQIAAEREDTVYGVDYYADKFDQELIELERKRPDLASAIQASRRVRDVVHEKRREQERLHGIMLERAGAESITGLITQPGYLLGSLVGAMAGMTQDPMELAVMAVTGYAGGPTKSLLKNAVYGGLVNAAGQAMVEPFSQSGRAQSGLPTGLDMAAMNVAAAFGLGAFLDVGVRAPLRGVRAATGIDLMPAPFGEGRLLPGYVGREGLGGVFRDLPPPPPPPAPREPARTMEELGLDKELLDAAAKGDAGAQAEIANRLKLDDDPAVRGVAQRAIADELTSEAYKAFKEGIDDGEGFRHLLATVRALNEDGQMPPARVPEIIPEASGPRLADDADLTAARGSNQHASKLTFDDGRTAEIRRIDMKTVETARQVRSLGDKVQWLEGRAGRAVMFEGVDGSRVLIDGNRRADLAKRSSGETMASAVVFREADGWSQSEARAFGVRKNLQEGSLRDPLEIAAEIRRQPGLIDRSVEITEPIRQARELASLSEEAWRMVTTGDIDPQHAMWAARYAPEDSHASMAKLLKEEGVEDEAVARETIAEATPPPKTEPLDRGVGVDDPAGAAGKEQLRQLEDQHADVIKEAVKKPERRAKALEKSEKKIAKLREDIAELGGKSDPSPADVRRLEGKRAELRQAMKDKLALIDTKRDRLKADIDTESAVVKSIMDRAAEIVPDDVKVVPFRSVSELPGRLKEEVVAAGQRQFMEAVMLLQRATTAEEQARIRSRIELIERQQVAEGFFDDATSTIYVATYALDPNARLTHETVHALFRTGRLEQDEVRALAERSVALGYMPEGLYRPEAEARAAALPEADRAAFIERFMAEEAAAHLLDAVVRGARVALDPPTRSIIDRIIEFFQRLRGNLKAEGVDNVAQLVSSILKGEAAKRELGRAVEVEAAELIGPIERYQTEGEAVGQPMMAIADRDTGQSMPRSYDLTTAGHVSKYEFDRFDWNKIGGGEGGQWFGYGHYFASSDRTLDVYEKAFTRNKVSLGDATFEVDSVVRRRTGVSDARSFEVDTEGLDLGQYERRDKALRDAIRNDPVIASDFEASPLFQTHDVIDLQDPLYELIHQVSSGPNWRKAVEQSAKRMAQAGGTEYNFDALTEFAKRVIYRWVEDGTIKVEEQKPVRYRVQMDLDPDRTIELDKPLADQSAFVQDALKRFVGAKAVTGQSIFQWLLGIKPKDAPDGYGLIRDAINRQENRLLSERLAAAGVHGYKFLNGKTRGKPALADPDAYNYVVLHDDRIEITHKDGQPVEAASKAPVRAGLAGAGDGKHPFMRGQMMFAIGDRSLDELGYYSAALEAAKSWPQKKGTPEQALMWLKKSNVKDNEIEATGLKAFVEGKTSITREELVQHLEQNRVRLNEASYIQIPLADLENALMRYDGHTASQAQNLSNLVGMRKIEPEDVSFNPEVLRIAKSVVHAADFGVGKPRFSDYSLDPSNPTYRETVLHLPAKKPSFDSFRSESIANGITDESAIQRNYDRLVNDASLMAREDNGNNFRGGHFSEPNITGHMMTSIVRHQDKPVYLVDQIQSDWGQRLREDGGARDEAKIAELRERIKEVSSKHQPVLDDWTAFAMLMREGRESENWPPTMSDGNITNGTRKATNWYANNQGDMTPEQRADFQSKLLALETAEREVNLLAAELRTAEAAVSGNPLVNTTDQWVNTTLRRAITQAVEADVDYIAIPSGDTVLSYNPGDTDGMRGFYDGIVPKNLRNLLKKLDKSTPNAERVDQLETPTSGMKGKGFTVFPITDSVKAKVRAEGQPMFALREPELPEGISTRSYTSQPPVSGFPTLRGQPMFAIRAYHGSPHDFDRFDMNRIGTGEGAQVFGHGLYFTDRKDLAEHYIKVTTGVPSRFLKPIAVVDGVEYDEAISEVIVTVLGKTFLRSDDGSLVDNKTFFVDADDAAKAKKEWTALRARITGDLDPRTVKYFESGIAFLDAAAGKNVTIRHDEPKGRLYEVEIDVDQDRLLHWDKPPHKQSKFVRDAISKVDIGVGFMGALRRALNRTPLERGAFVSSTSHIGAYIKSVGDQEKLAQNLRSQGVQGVAYLDRASRWSGEGTYNYVVFDDSLIRIVAKDGKPVAPDERSDVVGSTVATDQPMFALRDPELPEGISTRSYTSQPPVSGFPTLRGQPMFAIRGVSWQPA